MYFQRKERIKEEFFEVASDLLSGVYNFKGCEFKVSFTANGERYYTFKKKDFFNLSSLYEAMFKYLT